MPEERPSTDAEAIQRLIKSNKRLMVSNICLTAAILILTAMMLLVMHQT